MKQKDEILAKNGQKNHEENEIEKQKVCLIFENFFLRFLGIGGYRFGAELIHSL